MKRIRLKLMIMMMGVLALVPELAAAQALPSFKTVSVSWYQGAPVLKQRLGPEGAKTISVYLDALNSQAESVFARVPRGKPVSGAIVVAIKPGKQARFWIVQEGESLDATLIASLQQALSKPEPATVQGGPVAIALIFDAWGGGPPITSPTSPFVVPPEWLEAQQDPRAVGPLPDGPLAVLWPDAPAAKQ